MYKSLHSCCIWKRETRTLRLGKVNNNGPRPESDGLWQNRGRRETGDDTEGLFQGIFNAQAYRLREEPAMAGGDPLQAVLCVVLRPKQHACAKLHQYPRY